MADTTAQSTWEKPRSAIKVTSPKRLRFAIAGALLIGAVVFLIVSGTANGGQYFMTINELQSRSDLAGKQVRISGAVIGSSIRFDAGAGTIHFTIANITDNTSVIDQEGGLARALHLAATDPNAHRIDVIYRDQAIPDLLKDEAQAVVSGTLGPDGVFVASEVLLKCPSKYSSDVPQQAQQASAQ
jgi:cytochrome c-type biogenesis protein CcmE